MRYFLEKARNNPGCRVPLSLSAAPRTCYLFPRSIRCLSCSKFFIKRLRDLLETIPEIPLNWLNNIYSWRERLSRFGSKIKLWESFGNLHITLLMPSLPFQFRRTHGYVLQIIILECKNYTTRKRQFGQLQSYFSFCANMTHMSYCVLNTYKSTIDAMIFVRTFVAKKYYLSKRIYTLHTRVYFISIHDWT